MVKRIHSILFVDDDPLILKGIRRSLEEYEGTWSVDFALSGRAALEKLYQQPFDAVITDMHMPGMDGVQLLEVASRDMPGVMRFVLSGNASDSQILSSTHLVHQMIPKPSDMERVFEIVERACCLRDMLTDPKLLHIITGIKTLPSVPQLYNRLIEELQSENASAQTVGNIIAQDLAMTAKILQLVNSAFFSLADHVSSPQRAVTILGLNMVKALVLGIHVFSEYQGRTNLPLSMDALWKHSILVSKLSYDIARSLNFNTQRQEDARAAGLLHDIGKLILLKIPDFLQEVQLKGKGLISVELEYRILGTSHAEMGAYLLGIWGLPDSIVEAIIFHHRPGAQISESAELVTALHVANGLVNMCQIEKETPYELYLDTDYLKKLAVMEQLDKWTSMTRELMGSTG